MICPPGSCHSGTTSLPSSLNRHSGATRSVEPGIRKLLRRFRVRAGARPGMTCLVQTRRSADERTITVRESHGANPSEDAGGQFSSVHCHRNSAVRLLSFLRDHAANSSWPGEATKLCFAPMSRPSTSYSPPESKPWMPGTSARSKASHLDRA